MAQSVGNSEELKAPLYALDDFLSITYSTLFVQERNRKVGKRKHEKSASASTALTFQKPVGLFVESDLFAGILSIPK
jgi:hypothetical protein